MRTLEHITSIDASCDAVWAALVDLPSWPTWNVVHPDPAPPPVEGEGTRLRLQLRPGRGVTVSARWEVVRPGRALAWSGGVPRVFKAVHGFELTPEGEGCRLRHHETFSGALHRPAMRLVARTLLERYREVNDALARHVTG